MLSLAIFGGNRIDGASLDACERVVGLALFGGLEFDFTTAPPPPAIELVAVALFGGVNVKVRPEQEVRMTGFSVFGGRNVEPRRQLPPPVAITAEGDDDLPLEIAAYSVFGGISVERKLPAPI